MSNTTPLDAETLAFAARVFDVARHGGLTEMADFLDHGLRPDMRNDKGDSLLMLAAYNGNGQVAELLLNRGADPDLANDKGQTPLMGVCFKGETAIAATLLAHGATADGPPGSDRTPLMIAAMFDKVEIAEALLARGADPARKDGVAYRPPTSRARWARRACWRSSRPGLERRLNLVPATSCIRRYCMREV